MYPGPHPAGQALHFGQNIPEQETGENEDLRIKWSLAMEKWGLMHVSEVSSKISL
ncbi:hypothetical protein DPMN_180196 [Dreissena polymorpha]|uniref:Uncharacterized protein n=1 Tax=Dreissena polymorpha TaxID=45954 RepID=A0A9D4EFG4_DREPO|nr:hypothetical protein DPMN_180196 [Dreissena polymorpha]